MNFETELANAAKRGIVEGVYPLLLTTELPLLQAVSQTLKTIKKWVLNPSCVPDVDIETLKSQASLLFSGECLWTRYDFFDSQDIFNLLLELVEIYPGKSDIDLYKEQTGALFEERIRKPHLQISETFSMYSRFLSEYFPDSYTTMIKQANGIYQKVSRLQEDLEIEAIKKVGESQEDWNYRIALFISSSSRRSREAFAVNIAQRMKYTSNSLAVWKVCVQMLYSLGKGHDSAIKNFLLKQHDKFKSSDVYAACELLNNDLISQGEFDKLVEGIDHFENWNSCQLARIYKSKTKLQLDKVLDECWEYDDSVFHQVPYAIANVCRQESSDFEGVVYEQLTKRYPQQAELWLKKLNYTFMKGSDQTLVKEMKNVIEHAETIDWPERIFEECISLISLTPTRGEGYREITYLIAKKRHNIILSSSQLVEEMEESSTMPYEDGESRKRPADDSEEDSHHVKKEYANSVRNREHFTVAVSNLPINITERQLKQFFHGYGDVREINLTVVGETQEASVEFSSEQDVEKALVKDYKRIRGNEVRVQKVQNNTLFVTNFPPSYTPENIKDIFCSVGPVASVRFPSLKFNADRRFCYVEYTNSSNAQSAVALFNGKVVDEFRLSVQISNPSLKHQRSGAREEGREVYISSLNFQTVTAHKLKVLFEKYGSVENVNLPLSDEGAKQGRKNDGYGFVIFKTAAEATRSLELDLVAFEGRAIHVSIAKKRVLLNKMKATRALKDLSLSDSAIAVLNLPDTVNSSQLRDFFGSIDDVEDVILEPRHGGAIVVFASPQSSGKIGLLMNGKTIGNYTVEIGTVSDLKKSSSLIANQPTTTIIPSSVRRKKMGTFVKALHTHNNDTQSELTVQNTAKGRTNEDFRNMFLKK